MSTNLSITYTAPWKLEAVDLPIPKREFRGKILEHAVIVKVIATNICGSDQHIYRGRFDVPAGTVLGHEITGEIIEIGRDVLHLAVGDIVSVPFNVSCGRCRNCKTQHPEVCETVNDQAPLGAYGFDLGGWQGGQSQYCLVPYADFALLKFPDRDQALDRMMDLAFLSDILPTGYHGCVSAKVKPGSTVYIAGAGPVGRAAAMSARLLGASCVIIGDQNKERLAVLKKGGYQTVDLSTSGSLKDKVDAILGVPEVDCGVDAVGYEAHGHGENADTELPETALNDVMDITRAGGSIGIPGIYVGGDPGSKLPRPKKGTLDLILGQVWVKSLTMTTGMAPVMNYSYDLMQAILWNRIDVQSVMDIKVVPLTAGVDAYKTFSDGSPKKFVLNPNGYLKNS
ncbi:alcohol dehydrogenase catalytic domain-containing protein [Bizionia saleffrena]|uniref:Alcohol dehydrogenase catalytic domain-containing protein n=1 Tax=Bizionia saleffrena TaxID=291189 RepID=A0A8H2LFV8_9FLAO|nr:alcohol dehydrogenase catalytic domain-containing protein [Bizionia saleffrena]